MNKEQKLKLLALKQTLEGDGDAKPIDLKTLELSILDLSETIEKGIEIKKNQSVEDLVENINTFGQAVVDHVKVIQSGLTINNISDVAKLFPKEFTLKNPVKEVTVSNLKELGYDKLADKLDALNKSVKAVNKAINTPDVKGQNAEDYTPVRIVVGEEGRLNFLKQMPTPTFVGGGGQSTPDSFTTGAKSVTTAGTRVVLGANVRISFVTIKADRDNSGDIYVGNSAVSSANGWILAPGETLGFAINRLNKVYIDSEENGDSVRYQTLGE